MRELSDDQIVTRLRGALDELTADVDTTSDDLLPSRPAAATAATPRRRVAWAGAAAVTLLLAAGAVWALGTRTDDPLASSPGTPDTASDDPGAPAPATTATTAAPTPSVPVEAPSFVVTSARLAPGPQSSEQVEPLPDSPMLFLTWRIEGVQDDGGSPNGFLFATVGGQDTLPEGGTTEQLEPPSGDAVLVRPALDESLEGTPWIRWTRPDGGVWAFQVQGWFDADSPDGWIDLVFEAVPGSGLPIVIPDERASLVAFGGVSTTVVTQAYTSVDGGTVDLTVTDGGAAPAALAGATEVREVTVAGGAGWLGTYADGHVEVVWDAGGGWWGLLGIGPDLADQADDVVASVVRSDGRPSAVSVPAP